MPDVVVISILPKFTPKVNQGKAYVSILLRESFRVGHQIKSRTLAVLTHLPAHVLAAVRRAIAQPQGSLANVADGSKDGLQLRTAESLGAIWTVEQVADRLGIKKALGVTAQAQTMHDRYQDLARVERDFRTLKTGPLEFRPWFVGTAENTQAHALTAMLALKVRRHLEPAWWPLAVTVEEGLRKLETRCVIGLVQGASGKVVARQVPARSARQQQLLSALKLTPPSTVPEAKVEAGARKKIHQARKTPVK